jgi:integrase
VKLPMWIIHTGAVPFNFQLDLVYPLENYKTKRLKAVRDMTVNRELITLKAMFHKVVEWGCLSKNPAENIKLFKIRRDKRPRFLSVGEIKSLLQACTEGLYPIVYTALNTGMRSSELVYLRWKDVDLSKREITVHSRKDWQSKSGKSRAIAMNDKLFGFLKQHHQKSEYVFCTKDSRPLVNNLNRRFRNAARRARLIGISIHTLRHTFASHLVMASVPLATVSRLLGHADIKTTMIYAHLSPNHLQDAVNKVNF